MNYTRILRFEVMEPRIALSANASEMLAYLQADIAADGFNSQQAQEILEQTVKSPANLSIGRPTPPPTNEWGDGPIVRFRVDIRDWQDQPVNTVQAGGEYLARVFVRDMRDQTTDNPIGGGDGGVFKAWVDLEFSANLYPTGSVRVNEAYSTRKLDPEIEGSFLRNLGGVARELTPLGDSEQFLLEAPFVVGNADTPNRIQVVPSTSEHDPVILFGSVNPVPNQNIASSAFELLRAPNIDSSASISAPLIDRSDALSTDSLPSAPPSTALANSGDGSRNATWGDDSIALVSYIPFFADDEPDSRGKWRDEDDWWRSKRGENEKHHADDWNQLDWPDEEGKAMDTKSVNRSDASSTDDKKSDDEESEDNPSKGRSKHAGLFYDETLFLEGALVETFQSKFRMHLQIFAPQWQANEDTSESLADKRAASHRDDFIDIAEILTPNQGTERWRDTVDEAIAGRRGFPLPIHQSPAIDWGTIEPLADHTNAHQQSEHAKANQKIPDQRTPLAMNQSANSSSDAGPTTVQ